MNIAPVFACSGSVDVNASIQGENTAGSPNIRRVRAAASVIDTGQASPNSACTKMYDARYFASGGCTESHPCNPFRCDMADRPYSLYAARHSSR